MTPVKARRDLDRIKIEAEQKITAAKAEAESLRLQRDNISLDLIELRKIEAARALVRRVMEYNATALRPSMLASTSAKVTATQTAFEVASDALQMFGGNGLSREYPMEKLFRDARSLLVADGNNEVLAMKGARRAPSANFSA